MFAYRLSKYDPSKRSSDGHFTANEWTSVSDIGRTFDGGTVSLSDYMEAEDAYVDAVRTMLSCFGYRLDAGYRPGTEISGARATPK